ncbi:MAG: MerR family DNA-binding transcriptional regulator [Phormidium tanganyikae FI6-MK23]|nr:MerR family DNA-binding transcriptional regulator [Phormidium tanganyikae FI6-MK23]
MDDELTIQQVAALTQLSSHTLRYYERIGLLTSIERASIQWASPLLSPGYYPD